MSLCKLSDDENKISFWIFENVTIFFLYDIIGIPLTSRETPLSKFQDLDLWPGIYSQASILNGNARGVNICFNMRLELWWTIYRQRLDRTFNMLLGPSSNYIVLYVLAPGIDCPNAY